MTPGRLSEFQRIDRFLQPLSVGYDGAFSLQDDVAHIDVPDGHMLVTSTDAIVEKVHFLSDDPPDTIAQKLMRVNVSDLLAKGARPYLYKLMLALPKQLDDDWVQLFCSGLQKDQKQYGLFLIGGDCVSTDGPIVLSLTVFGLVEQGRMIRRTLAPENKNRELGVYVTGQIGNAYAGLCLLEGASGFEGVTCQKDFISAYRIPQIPFESYQQVNNVALAALDVSDGLIADAGHLAELNHGRIELDFEQIPVHKSLKHLPFETKLSFLSAGDDYQILFLADSRAVYKSGVSAFRIGRFRPTTQGSDLGVSVFNENNELIDLHGKFGWAHN